MSITIWECQAHVRLQNWPEWALLRSLLVPPAVLLAVEAFASQISISTREGGSSHRSWWWDLIHMVAAVRCGDGVTRLCVVVIEVIDGHDTAMLVHSLDYGFCYPSPVEACTRGSRHDKQSSN